MSHFAYIHGCGTGKFVLAKVEIDTYKIISIDTVWFGRPEIGDSVARGYIDDTFARAKKFLYNRLTSYRAELTLIINGIEALDG